MPEINGTYIENKSQENINKELSKDYKNFEKIDGYNNEMAALGKKYLDKMGEKIKSAREKIIDNKSLKSKYPEKYDQFAQKFKKYQNEITEHTKSLNNKERRKRHEVHINKLGSIIDNYENEAIQLIYELVEDMGDAEAIQTEKGKVEKTNGKVKYLDIGEDGIYTLTKATNRPKIHQVLGNVLSPGEVRKIDYSDCTNSGIKKKMAAAISSNAQEGANSLSYSCFLNYDQTSKTYVLSDGSGHPISQRALIWEGVKLTPPSKIRGEAKIAKKEAEKAQIEKINNINLTEQEQQDLYDSMPEKLRKSLKKEDRDTFFQITESSINEAIKQAKLEGYELQSEPVGKDGGRNYYVTLNLRNAGSKAEVERPFIKKEDLKKYGIKDNNKFKNYISQRVSAKRNSFDYLTKKGSTIKEGEYGVGNELDENKKEFSLKGLDMLETRADSVLNTIGDTDWKDDDIEFTAIKTYIRDLKNDIETGKFTDNNLEKSINELGDMLKNFFKHNLRSFGQINGKKVNSYLNDILSSGDKKKQIIALRKIGASRTILDNSDTTFLRDEIQGEYEEVTGKRYKQARDEKGNPLFDKNNNPIYEQARDEDGNLLFDTNGDPIYVKEVTDKSIDLKNDDYEIYFQNIYKLYGVDNVDMIYDKKGDIDELYNKAIECQGKGGDKKFWMWLQSKKLLPPHLTGHGGQWKDKIRELKDKLCQQKKNVDRFNITGSEIRERTRQQLAELQLTLTSQQKKQAEEGKESSDPYIIRLNALNFMLVQDDEFFNTLAEDELNNTKKRMMYMGVDNMVKGSIGPYLIRRGGGINSDDEIAKIYNDSVGAGGWLDFSDEGIPHMTLTEILIEVAITAVSIALSPTGAGVAIALARQAAKAALKKAGKAALKAAIKEFLRTFVGVMKKNLLKKISTKAAKKVGNATAKVLGKTAVKEVGEEAAKGGFREMVKGSVRASVNRAKNQTLKSALVHGTNLAVEGTFFHLNSTILHNAINGASNREDLLEGCAPRGYTEGPDGEKIPNRKGYVQSIAFLGVLKSIGRGLQDITGEGAKALLKGGQSVSVLNKAAASTLGMLGEMGGMMATEQILSLTFDQTPAEITGESFMSMIGMIVGLRFVGKCELKIKEYNGRRTNLEMRQEGTGNTFNVHMDNEGNVLKVEGVDKNGKKIKNPEQVCGIKAGDNGMNMRDIPNAMGEKTGTIEGGSRAKKNLDNLNTGDEITIKQGKNNIKLKKTADGKREVTDPGGNTAYDKGTKFEIEQNSNDKSYHLKNTEGRGTISLDGNIDVRLQSRFGNNLGFKSEIKRPEIEKTREKVENKKLDIEKSKNKLKETQKKIEGKEKEIKELERIEKDLNTKKEELEKTEKHYKEVGERLKQKESELKDAKEKERSKLNELESQALKKLEGNNIYIDGVEYSCSYTETNPDGTTQLIIKRTGNTEQKFPDGTVAPEKIPVTSFRQLQTIATKGLEGKTRKVSATENRNNIHEQQLNKGQIETQNILNTLFNPKAGELGDQIQQSRTRIKNINDRIQINEQDIAENQRDITNKQNEIKKVNEDLLNNQREQIRTETEIRKLREEEKNFNSEIEKGKKELQEIDKELLQAETDLLERELNEMESRETITIEGKDVKVTDELKESTRNQIRQNKEKLGISGNENTNRSTIDGISDVEYKLSYEEKQVQLLKQRTKELESQLEKMQKNKNGEIEIDGYKVTVTEELIEATRRQIKLNNEKLNGHRAKLGEKRGGTVNVEQDGTISILKTDFSVERILPDGTICKGDFDMNGNLVSGIKIYEDGSIEHGVFNEKGEMFLGMKEVKLKDGGFKQTYTTLDGIYEVKFDANNKMIGNMEKIEDAHYTTVPTEKARNIFERFKDFKEDLKNKQEQRRVEREQRVKERKEARAKQLTYEEKKILKDIIKDVPTLPKGISTEYDLGNGGKIRIKKLSNGKIVEMNTSNYTQKGREMTTVELETHLKRRIIESRIGEKVANKGKESEIITTTKEDGSTFIGEVDMDGNRMQGEQTLKDGTIKKGFFVDKELNEGIIIKNENGIKKIEFKGKADKDFIKKEIAEIEKTINSNEKIEIKLSEDKTIKIEKKGSDLIEVIEGEGTNNIKIERGTLGEYVEKRVKEVRLKQEIDKFTTSKAEKEQELQKLKEKGNLTDDELTTKEKLEKQIKSYEKAIEALNDRNTNYESGIKRVKEKINKQKEKLNKLNKNSSEYRNTEKDIKNLEKQLKGYETAQDIMQNGTEIVKKVSRREILKKELETLVLKAKKLVTRKESNEYKELEIKINNLNKEINNLKTDIQKFIDITYIGIRDLKGLGDEDLMYLTHTYLEKILDPIKFSVIDHLSTFNPLKVDQNFQSIKKFETTGKGTEIGKLQKIENDIQKIKKGGYDKVKSMAETKGLIEKFGEGTYERDILNNLKESLENNISSSDHRLLDSERAVIFVNSVAYMLDYKAAFPNATAEQIYKILDRNQNKLIHQHIQDKRYLTGSSHDALHILRGNMDMAEKFMKNMSPIERVMTRQIIIDHDMGYTSQFNNLLSRKRSNTFFSSTKDHPLRSTVFVEQNKSRYIENFGKKGYDIIEKSITGHSKADTKNLPTEGRKYRGMFDEKVINSVISTVDCAAASADYKSAFLFSHPEMTGQFLNVYKTMKKGDINDAIKYLEKMADIAKSVKDPKLRNALEEALNSLHLVNVHGESQSILRKKINEIDNSSSKELTTDFIDNLIKSYDANSDNPTKKFKKIIKKFETANNRNLDVKNIETLEEIKNFCEKHREYFEGNNGEGESPIKKYLKYDYIDERVSFPFEKYLSQYGVRVSRTETGEIKINSNNKGIVEAEFELAGKTFENLVNEGDANFALASFKKVCDDFNIDIKNNTGIKDLEEIINEWKKGKNKTLIQTLKDNINGKEFKDKKGNIVGRGFGEKIELYGKNGEKVTLNFDGKNYEGFDRSYLFTQKIDNIRNGIGINTTGDYIIAFRELVNNVNEIYGNSNTYQIDGKPFARYIDGQCNSIGNCRSKVDAIEIVNQTLNQIELGTFARY